jgi:hypothetical protein
MTLEAQCLLQWLRYSNANIVYAAEKTKLGVTRCRKAYIQVMQSTVWTLKKLGDGKTRRTNGREQMRMNE